MANNPSFLPWVHHQNSSSTSISRLGLERAVPPGQTVAALTPANDYLGKELPPVPNVFADQDRPRLLGDQTAGAASPKRKNIVRSQNNNRIDGSSQSPIESKSHSLPESVSGPCYSTHCQPSAESSKRVLPPPPLPPMSKSAQKILQITGFDPSLDPSFDREPQAHYSVSPESSASSGSQYSHSEREIQDYGAAHSNHWGSQSSTRPIREELSAAYLQTSTCSVNSKSAIVSELSVQAVAAASASAASLSLRTRDRLGKDGLRKKIDIATEDYMERMTNEEFVIPETARYERQKRSRFNDGFEGDISSTYGQDLAGADGRDLIPRPLAIRSKGKGRAMAENEKLERHYMTPASPTGMRYDGMPACMRMPLPPDARPKTKRSFGGGKHPLKSTFPFTYRPKEPDPREQEQKIRKSFSGAMKRLSGRKKLPVKQTAISNSQRQPNRLDTRKPSSFGDHLQDVVDKAKKGLKIKTADEKRREDLKKNIVVVGITDQSPDGRVSEWL